MFDQAKIAVALERFRAGVFRHDEINSTHKAYGIGLAAFDVERLGFEHGEELWPGIVLEIDGGQTSNFRVLCDGQHGGKEQATEVQAREMIHAVGVEACRRASTTCVPNYFMICNHANN